MPADREAPVNLPPDLIYSTDTEPGILRKGAGKGFYYQDPDRGRVQDKRTLDRIRSLAIPPAYRKVWICRDPRGHLQATGRDARGRKQYRYHPDWSTFRNQMKFSELADFGEILPRLRRRIREDLKDKQLSHTRVVAASLRILDETGMRVGHPDYLQSHGSRGLTTLADENAELEGAAIHFHFTGKSGKIQQLDMKHPRVARVLARCMDLPGERLLQYRDDEGNVRELQAADINTALSEFGEHNFTSKTFRTWRASVCAWEKLTRAGSEEEPCPAKKKRVVEVVKEVAAEIGNRPATCRKHYIHPHILDIFGDQGWLPRSTDHAPAYELTIAEREFLTFLHTHV